MYMKTAEQLVINEQNKQASTSQVAARVGFLILDNNYLRTVILFIVGLGPIPSTCIKKTNKKWGKKCSKSF